MSEKEVGEQEETEEQPVAPEEVEERDAAEGFPDGEEPPAPEATDVLLKRVNDMQAWGTRLSQKNSELEREINALKHGSGTTERVADAARSAEKAHSELESLIEEFAQDYPEGKPVLQEMYASIRSLRDELAAIKSPLAQQTEEAHRARLAAEFKATVQPEIERVHQDFESIVLVKNPDGTFERNDEYFAWAEEQRPTLRMAALESSHPKDIIWAINEYKSAKNFVSGQAARQQRELNNNTKVATATSMRGSGSPAMPSARRPVSMDEMPVDEYIAMRRKQERDDRR